MIQTNENNIYLGWIDYWNLFPLKVEIEQQIKDSNISIVLEPNPRATNKKLLSGDYRVAPCSSILLNQENINMAASVGVACKGEVKSVFIGSKQDHPETIQYIDFASKELCSLWGNRDSYDSTDFNQLKKELKQRLPDYERLALKPVIDYGNASSTSAMMAKVLTDLFWPKEQVESNHDQPKFELVIGNEALARAEQYDTKIDLSQLWLQSFGLPFVFATFAAPLNLSLIHI